jgi:four helix bundle protein
MTKTTILSFTDLTVWQESHKLVLEIYKTSQGFPKSEVYGLSKQLRSAAVSITSNIAEGFGRKHYGEKVQFYYISNGSLTELQNQLMIAKDLFYISESKFQELFTQSIKIKKMLSKLIQKSQTFR